MPMEDIRIECAHDSLVKTSSLRPNPRNPNKHPKKQIELLAKIISGNGWRNPIVVSNRSGLIVKGHARWEAAKLLGVATVPVDYQDYDSDAAETADMLSDNRIAELAEPDLPALKDILTELDDVAFDLDLTGFDGDALEGLLEDDEQETELRPVRMEAPPPALAWVLIGIPLVRYGEIAEDITRMAGIDGVVVRTTVGDV